MSVPNQQNIFFLESLRCLRSAHVDCVVNSNELHQWTLRERDSRLAHFSQDRGARMSHEFIVNLIDFGLKTRSIYPKICKVVTRVLVMFPTNYLCGLVFSSFVAIKTKARNRLIDVNAHWGELDPVCVKRK